MKKTQFKDHNQTGIQLNSILFKLKKIIGFYKVRELRKLKYSNNKLVPIETKQKRVQTKKEKAKDFL